MYNQAISQQLILETNSLGSIYAFKDNSMHLACPFLNTNNSLSCGSRNHHTISFMLTSVI
jgi:hypothetical protein